MLYGGRRRRIGGRPVVRKTRVIVSATMDEAGWRVRDELTSGIEVIVLSTSFNQRSSLVSEPGERYRFCSTGREVSVQSCNSDLYCRNAHLIELEISCRETFVRFDRHD